MKSDVDQITSACQILRLSSVKQKTGLGRSTIYSYMQRGLFPKPILLGSKCVGWLANEVEGWLAQQIKSSRGGSHD